MSNYYNKNVETRTRDLKIDTAIGKVRARNSARIRLKVALGAVKNRVAKQKLDQKKAVSKKNPR